MKKSFAAVNVRVFNRIYQRQVAELLNCADFFILGSPVETQCLAAIEANLCNIPVVMPLVGIYRDFTAEERARVGIFGDDLAAAVAQAANAALPRGAQFLQKDLDFRSMKSGATDSAYRAGFKRHRHTGDPYDPTFQAPSPKLARKFHRARSQPDPAESLRGIGVVSL